MDGVCPATFATPSVDDLPPSALGRQGDGRPSVKGEVVVHFGRARLAIWPQ